jgi:tetratricopeptide (TPR) repeat protein
LQAATDQQRTTIQLALAAIITLLLWIACAILIFLWERRRHPDGRPKLGRAAIYVAELQGDDKKGSHRNHILLSLRGELGDCVQVLRAGIEPRTDEKGNPEDDARAANRKGQKYLNQGKHLGDLLIWGQVLDEKKLVELRFTSRAHDSSEQRRFAFAEKMLLEPLFGPELGTALAAIATQLALPANDDGNYVVDVLLPVAEKLGNIAANLPSSMTQGQRGLLLRSYADSERVIGVQRGDSEALMRAVAAYKEASNGFTQQDASLDWAKTQLNLSFALRALGGHENGTASLKAAIAACHEALKEYRRERVPLQWARSQNSLGNVLLELGKHESGTEQLEAAVAAYSEALREFTRESIPHTWAMTQNNLGYALQVLGERECGTQRLEDAVVACREALKEFTRKKVPLDWAMTQNNLGNALATLGEREIGTERLEAAIEAYREALKEYTRERVPLKWAMTQSNLGEALQALGERESGTVRLEAAVEAYHEALKERTREKVPLKWAATQNYLGKTLESMGKFEKAAESYRLALQEYTLENHALNHKIATDNLARVLEKLCVEPVAK